VRVLIDNGADVDVIGPRGLRPIHIASQMEDGACLRELLDHGADINAHQGGITALHAAAWHGAVDNVRLLLERGAGVDARATCGWVTQADGTQFELDGLAPVDFAKMVVNGHECVEALLAAASAISARMAGFEPCSLEHLLALHG